MNASTYDKYHFQHAVDIHPDDWIKYNNFVIVSWDNKLNTGDIDRIELIKLCIRNEYLVSNVETYKILPLIGEFCANELGGLDTANHRANVYTYQDGRLDLVFTLKSKGELVEYSVVFNYSSHTATIKKGVIQLTPPTTPRIETKTPRTNWKK